MRKRIGLGRARLEADSKKLLDIISGSTETENVVIFKMDNKPWAVFLNHVVRILRTEKVKFFSYQPSLDFVVGYISFRKKAVPLFGLHKKLGIELEAKIDQKKAIIICKVGNATFGIPTDEVMEVLPLGEKGLIKNIPRNLFTTDSRMIAGCMEWRDQAVLYMNVLEMLSKQELEQIIIETVEINKELVE